MNDLVIWEHLRHPAARFWFVCAKNDKGKYAPIVIPYSQAMQEAYVESEDQHEGILNVFTTPGGADRYKAGLLEDGDEGLALEVKKCSIDDLLKIIKGVDTSYRIQKQHSVRVDVYDIRGLTPRREVLYSRWVTKH